MKSAGNLNSTRFDIHLRTSQPRPQASLRYPNEQRRLGIERLARIFPTSYTYRIAEDDWEQG